MSKWFLWAVFDGNVPAEIQHVIADRADRAATAAGYDAGDMYQGSGRGVVKLYEVAPQAECVVVATIERGLPGVAL